MVKVHKASSSSKLGGSAATSIRQSNVKCIDDDVPSIYSMLVVRITCPRRYSLFT